MTLRRREVLSTAAAALFSATLPRRSWAEPRSPAIGQGMSMCPAGESGGVRGVRDRKRHSSCFMAVPEQVMIISNRWDR